MLTRMLFTALLALAVSAGVMAAPDRQSDPIASGEDLVRAMHARYADSWYSTLTFVQHTVVFPPDGSRREQTWYEALALPGQLRIDIAPLENRDMNLYARDSVYIFRDGMLAHRARDINILMLLGFDVYGYAPEKTIAELAAMDFDLAKVRRDTWQDRPVYVVGAAAGDDRSAQFWVDAERLVFIRLIQPKSGRVQEILFNEYEPLAGGWIAPEVMIYLDGKLVMSEHYTSIRADVDLDPLLFDPLRWQEASWWE
jgi:hypothetical protein